jgi:hypothetical protein
MSSTRSTSSAERSEGPTPAGGAYAIAYHYDDGSTEIVEFDSAGAEIERTYSPDPRGLMINDDILLDDQGVEIPQPPDPIP